MAVLNPQADIQALTNVSALADRRTKTAHLLHDTSGKPRRGVMSGFGNELVVSAPGGLAVSVASGCAVLPAPQAGHGAWTLVNDAPMTINLATAHPSNARIDLVIARVADAFYYTGGDNLATVKVLTGTPSTSPAIPTIPTTEGSYIVLARIAVAAGATAISASNVTLNDINSVPRTCAAGGVLQVARDSDRDALLNAVPFGQIVWVYATGIYWGKHASGWLRIYYGVDVDGAITTAVGAQNASMVGAFNIVNPQIAALTARTDTIETYVNDPLQVILQQLSDRVNAADAKATNAQGRLSAHGW